MRTMIIVTVICQWKISLPGIGMFYVEMSILSKSNCITNSTWQSVMPLLWWFESRAQSSAS